MGIWEDTFGEGSQFQRVVLLGPLICFLVLSIGVGGAVAGPAGVVLGPLFGLVVLIFFYLGAFLPCVMVWFLFFRVARLLGLGQQRAAFVAAPVVALVASFLLIAGISLWTDGQSGEFAQGRWNELLPSWLVVVAVSVVVALLMARGRRPTRRDPSGPLLPRYREPRPWDWDEDDRFRLIQPLLRQGRSD